MEPVQSGHGIIEAIENDLPVISSQEARGIRIKTVSDFYTPFDIFDSKK